MTNRLKKQARRNAAGQAALERLVLEAHEAGQSLRQIAEAAGMTPEGVRKMLVRLAAKAACKYIDDGKAEGIVVSDEQIQRRKKEIYKPLEHYKIYNNAVVAGDVNPHFINPKQGLDRLQKLMDEYCGGVTVSYMTNEKLLHIGLKKLAIMEEDLQNLAAKDIHELLRAWELMHRHRAAECVTQHTLFRKETRWPGYYYRGDAMKVDDENWHVLTVSRRDPQTGEYTMEKAPCYHLVGENE